MKAMTEPTVVLIHGLSEQGRVWDRQIAALNDGFAPVTYDVRGFGLSPLGRGDGTVEQLADDLGQVMSAARKTKAHLIGFSMGGVVAQKFAVDHPEAVDRLVLIATSSGVGASAAQFFDDRIELASEGPAEAFAERNHADAHACFHQGGSALREEYARLRGESVTSREGYVNACRAMRRLHEQPLTPELSRIRHRTLVVCGSEDRYCPPEAAQILASHIPNASLKILEGAGHCLHWERPEELNELVREFLTGG